MLIPVLGKELAGVTYYTPEELKYLDAVKLKKQPHACATIARTDLASAPQMVKILTVLDYPFDEQKVRAANVRSQRAHPTAYLSISETARQIEERQQIPRALSALLAHKEDDTVDAEVIEITPLPKKSEDADKQIKQPASKEQPILFPIGKVK
jgi:hypothetical protein